MIEQHSESTMVNWKFNKENLYEYMEQHRKNKYININLKEMRKRSKNPDFQYQIGEQHKQRIPSPFIAFWNEVYLDALGTFQRDWRQIHDIENLINTFISILLPIL